MKLFLISPKNVYATRRLIEEATRQGIDLTVKSAGELIKRNYDVNPAHFDALYIRQAYTEFKDEVPTEHLQSLVDLAQRFTKSGKVVVDATIAEGDIGQGKYRALMRLREQGILLPATEQYSNAKDLSSKFPFIAKWNYGFGSKHTYLIKTQEDLQKVEQKYERDQILVQEFIPADFEYKVIIVGYKSLPVIIKLKTNQNKFLPDLNSAQVLRVADTSKVAALAERAAQVLQRELAKVDILEANGQLYVLEVNRWPGLQYFEKATQYNVAADFLAYLKAACKKS